MMEQQYITPVVKIFSIQSRGVIMTSGLEYKEGGEGIKLIDDIDEGNV